MAAKPRVTLLNQENGTDRESTNGRDITRVIGQPQENNHQAAPPRQPSTNEQDIEDTQE